MWTGAWETLGPGKLRLVPHFEYLPVSYADMIGLLQTDASCRDFLSASLADLPYPAFTWETPGMVAGSLRKFECVVMDAPYLLVPPDLDSFDEHFADADTAPVVAFPNLSGSSMLVAPTPLGEPETYASFAPFLRQAPDVQKHALWRSVGKAMQARLGARPVWLSTAGAGVAWLHVRLDGRPKYYRHRPYCVPPI
jgi:hypothetical protein